MAEIAGKRIRVHELQPGDLIIGLGKTVAAIGPVPNSRILRHLAFTDGTSAHHRYCQYVRILRPKRAT